VWGEVMLSVIIKLGWIFKNCLVGAAKFGGISNLRETTHIRTPIPHHLFPGDPAPLT